MAPASLRDVSSHLPLATSTTDELSRRKAVSSRPSTGNWRAVATDEDLVIESWSQGLIVGALLIMACITIANMRRGVLLHKLILVELLLAMSHGTFCFMTFDGYGWYLSSTAALLYCSWIMHNIVSWLKVRPFFSHPGGFFKPASSKWVKRIYIGTLCLSIPVIVFQISDNFRFFNNRGGWYPRVRPYEPLMRDPWWVFTALTLFHVIRKCYGTGVIELVRRSPRFGILLSAIFLSIVFTACDVAASISSSSIIRATEGINPWWKLSLVFKCLTDTIMLDDFKTELKKLGIKRIAKEEKRRNTISLVPDVHPLDAQASDDEEASSGRISERNSVHWYRTNPLVRTSTADDISPTTSTRKFDGEPHTFLRTPTSKPLNDPDATIDELEFSTALSLSPSRLSGVDSVAGKSWNESESSPQVVGRQSRDQEPRVSHANHTTRISYLPSLKYGRFESIKPGKSASKSASHLAPLKAIIPQDHNTIKWNVTNDTQASSSDQANQVASNSDNSHSTFDPHAGTSNGVVSTAMRDSEDLENQLNLHRGHVSNEATKRAAYPSSGGDSSDASTERVRRFKMSIGA